MTDIIQLLPDSVANQIAAGEVIQRPASVVKELVENAVDAGSTDIKINLSDAGKTLIQVIDNGKGMSETDARMAFERHATSKIRKAEDLFAIRTMGFRGEALASIAAIAQVELKSRRDEDELGTKIIIEASTVKSQENVQCSRGSNFLVKNLFYNIPARRKFLKSNTTELKHIINEFQRIALTQPEISFSLLHNNSEIYHLPSSNLLKRISQLFRKTITQSLIKIHTGTSIINIKGYIGKPEYAKKNSGEQFFFVNGRFMKHPYFHKAVMAAYQNILGPDTWPSYFINFEINPESVDINIHPTKTEIKFEDEVNIWKILNLSVKESLGKFNVSPSLDFETGQPIHIPVVRKDTQIVEPTIHIDPTYNPFEEGKRKHTGNGISATKNEKDNLDNWEKLYEEFEKHTPDKQITFTSNAGDNEEISNNINIDRKNLFQLKNRYILSPVKSGLMIIDQRRAHIRVLFENFKNKLENNKGFSQKVMFPVYFEPDAETALLLDEIMQHIVTIGFEITKTENGSYEINGTPADISNHDPKILIEQILENYKHTGVELKLKLYDKIAYSLAKASAITYGKTLSSEEMSELFDSLFACKIPSYTPSGKLILSIITLSEITNRLK